MDWEKDQKSRTFLRFLDRLIHIPSHPAMATASATGHRRRPYDTSVSRHVSDTRCRRREVSRRRNGDERRRRQVVARRIAAAVYGRALCLRNEFVLEQLTQRRTKAFTAVSSSHRPLQTEPKWRNCTGSCLDGQVWLSGFFELREQNRPQPRDPFLDQNDGRGVF